MAFVVASLANYTEENVTQLVASSVLGSKTITLIKDQGNVMLGVKSAETVNIMDTDAFFQDGSSCGFNASGTTTFGHNHGNQNMFCGLFLVQNLFPHQYDWPTVP
jgi:hypothetical protein